jgi:predicted Fe-S protein YdhL (DUF1289 family)
MKQSQVESPCIGVCQFPSGVCKGCGRTQEEAFEWYDMTDEQKQAVLNRLEKKSKGWFK